MKKLTSTELASRVGYSRPTVVALAKSGSIPRTCIRKTRGGARYGQLRFLNNGVLRRWISLNQRERRMRKLVQSQARRASVRRSIMNGLASDGPGIRLAVNACDELVVWMGSRPEGFWNAERARRWRENLEPIVKGYEELGEFF